MISGCVWPLNDSFLPGRLSPIQRALVITVDRAGSKNDYGWMLECWLVVACAEACL